MPIFVGTTSVSKIALGAVEVSVKLGTVDVGGGLDKVVNSSAELVTALAAATGGQTIKLAKAGGPYRVTSGTYAPNSEVIIESENYADPATIEFFGPITGSTGFTGCKNLTFRNIKFDRTNVSYSTVPQYVPEVWLESPDTVKFLYNDFKGRAVAWFPGNVNPTNIERGDKGIRVTSPKNCTWLGNTSSGNAFWLQSVGDGTDNNLVTGNVVNKGQADYIQFIGGGTNNTITNNVLLDTLGSINDYVTNSGNHDDFIQIATTGTATSWNGLVIEDNLLDTRGGDGYQGIFLGNEAAIAYQNVSIKRNRVMTNQLNGIAIEKVLNVSIEDNTVLWDASRTQVDDGVDPVPFAKPGIGIYDSSSTGNITRNVATDFVIQGTAVVNTDNLFLDYDNIYGTYYGDRIYPGINTTNKSFQIVNAKVEQSFPYGAPQMKDTNTVFRAVRNPNLDFVYGINLGVDPLFTDASNYILRNVNISGGIASETHTSNFWGLASGTGISGPKDILLVTNETILPGNGQFSFIAHNALPSTTDVVTNGATNRVYTSPRHQGAGWHVESINIPSGSTYYFGIAGQGGRLSALAFSQFYVYDMTNLVLDATMDNPGNWEVSGGTSNISGGKLNFNPASTTSWIRNISTVLTPGTYEVSYIIDSMSGAGVNNGLSLAVNLTSNSLIAAGGVNGVARSSAGTYTETMTITNAGNYHIGFRCRTTTPTAVIDNLKVKRIS